MYLVEIDKGTGLVKASKGFDGIMAIKDFRELIDDKRFGLAAMTCVALVADWLSPIRYFKIDDRPIKAMRQVLEVDQKIVWHNDKIQKALKTYEELQYNADLVEKRMLDKMLIDLLEKVDKTKQKARQLEAFKQLNTVKDLRNAWVKANQDNNPLSDGPVDNGYPLTRLEEKAIDRKSFYNV